MDYIRYILPLLAVVAIGLGGCTEAEDAPVLPEIDAVELAATELCIGGQGGDIVLRFKANRDWIITYVDDRTAPYGLLQTREGGAGTDCEVIYTAFPNTGESSPRCGVSDFSRQGISRNNGQTGCFRHRIAIGR